MKESSSKNRVAVAGNAAPVRSRLKWMLDVIERGGNKAPHPALIFVWLILGLIVLSQVLYLVGYSATYESINAETHQVERVTTYARGLLTADGIRFMYSNVVENFIGFSAVGVVIVAMLGVGVADSSGLIKTLVQKLVKISPPRALTYLLVFLGIISSIASDKGYLLLIPLGAAAFRSVGRHPLAGLAATFAAVAGTFSVNIVVDPVDGILTALTNDAIHLVDPKLSVSATANFWFSLASVALLTLVCGWTTDKLAEPRLGRYQVPGEPDGEPSSEQDEDANPAAVSRGLAYAGWGFLAFLLVFALLTIPRGALLRDPDTGALLDSPFMNGLIVFVALGFLIAGAAYGIGAKTMKGSADVIEAMEKAIVSVGPLLLLLFMASQFIAMFDYTNIATITAADMGDGLEKAGLGAVTLLLGFMILAILTNFFMTGTIPKWAIFAPAFVPLLMRLGVSPEAVLAAYRVSDSPFDLISPVMPYFPIIVGFASKYQPDAGLGTVIALMLPYLVMIQVTWIILFIAWGLLGLPWGF